MPPFPKLLTEDPAVLRERFLGMQTREDVASVLNYDARRLRFWAIHARPEVRYTEFAIPKASGGERTILAPARELRLIQRRLNQVLGLLRTPRRCSHAYTPGRSIVTNAMPHVGARVVINVDLEDFFPSIHFGRVRGMFMVSPFSFPPEVATFLAQICTHKGALPQGAPTSPLVSNMICYRLDRELTALAKKCGVHYTRYADDLTFSSRRNYVPPQLAYRVEADQPSIWSPGIDLQSRIGENGFSINLRKLRVKRAWHCQRVTGVTVNVKPNVSRKFVRRIFSELHVWRKYGVNEEKVREVRGRIEFVGQVRGKVDPIYLRQLARWYDLASTAGCVGTMPSALAESREKGDRLRAELDEIASLPDRRKAGFRFEAFLKNLFEGSRVSFSDSFRVTGEQIDGAFEHRHNHYLVEAKWHADARPASDVYAFLGKVSGKAAFTRGLFISMSGFSGECVSALQTGKEQRIILWNRSHLDAIVDGRISLAGALDSAVRWLAERGDPLCPVERLKMI